MANLTIDTAWTGNDAGSATWERLRHRLRVLARLHRQGRIRRARMRLARDEARDPAMLADIGIDPRRHRRYPWLEELTRAMGGR